MMAAELTEREYAGLFRSHDHCYNSAAFIALNAGKCERLRRFAFMDGAKPRFGITFGERQGRLSSPFSAPFGGFDFIRNPSVSAFDEALELLRRIAEDSGMDISVTLPPAFYSPRNLSLLTTMLANTRGIELTADYNYYFMSADFRDYQSVLRDNGRKNLRKAMTHDFRFVPVSADDIAGLERAYEVIRFNREQHGYPLRMTLDEVKKTVKIVPAEFFILSLDGADVAAAQVYFPAPGIAQVIYWGDVAGYSEARPMNMLARELFGYLSPKVGIVDVGPSSVDGIPSIGLCDFKESVGCRVIPKYRFLFPGK